MSVKAAPLDSSSASSSFLEAPQFFFFFSLGLRPLLSSVFVLVTVCSPSSPVSSEELCRAAEES